MSKDMTRASGRRMAGFIGEIIPRRSADNLKSATSILSSRTPRVHFNAKERDLMRKTSQSRARFCLLTAICVLLTTCVATASTLFNTPVIVTPYPGKGYEPGLVVDQY